MPFFSNLFGGKAAPEAETETYKDFTITPAPESASNGWRIGARIERDGQVHDLIRADVLQSKEQAEEASVAKAKQMIDEQGDRLFR
ncbi:hypothetical protein SAMN05421665_1545 [Yoonia rosea]|uniref:Transcriptional activator HlyU n=1 Tax=Yoonia rosea TaxID=287098 RepID=A0A1R3X0S2_9RHOB|nr:HlyU family transcriptional regulator [Yoonia rosea]SIT82827.1 hypothetical protein SAMN05421665_1545 [Yoonia rosea]